MHVYEAGIELIKKYCLHHYLAKGRIVTADLNEEDAYMQTRLFGAVPFTGYAQTILTSSYKKAVQQALIIYYNNSVVDAKITLDGVFFPQIIIASEVTNEWVRVFEHRHHGERSPEPTKGEYYNIGNKYVPAERCGIYKESYWIFWDWHQPKVSEATGETLSLIRVVGGTDESRAWLSPYEDGAFYYPQYYMVPTKVLESLNSSDLFLDRDGYITFAKRTAPVQRLLAAMKDAGCPKTHDIF